MAITDVRILRSLKISESKGDKQTVQLSATQQLLFLSDTKDPAFNEILEDTSVWPNLGNTPVPQLDDQTIVKGVTLFVSSRELAYYQDNERAVVMTVRYDAKAPETTPPSTPEGTEAATWKQMTVQSQVMTKPAVGWPSIGAIAGLDNPDEGNGAQNSAGDPVDGLEEECALVKATYTNTQVRNPVFAQLLRYTNVCNAGPFLGAPEYTVRMVGYNAEYDQRNNVWSVSVEFLYKPDGWQIRYFDAGYNEIVDGKRRVITDLAGNPVSKPVPLDGAGRAQTINGSPTGDQKPTDPITLELYPYKIADLSQLFANAGIQGF